MRILLISPYEIGRQPFSLAHPAALLRNQGHEVVLADLALESVPWMELRTFTVIGISLAMHTATRIAMSLLAKITTNAPYAHLICYGLYAPPNAKALQKAGVETVLGPEFEDGLLRAVAVIAGKPASATPVAFVTPDRHSLPALHRYAHLIVPNEPDRTVGFVETTRGCKYLCRHCPIVPLYAGRFRALPREMVLADARQQINAGAKHLSFGDPDFFNGPTHGLRIIKTLHTEYPFLTFDATIKISHIVSYADKLPELAANGCLFITTAVESFDDTVLTYLDKGHTSADVTTAAALMRQQGIALSPTFVPFTPWTTRESYRALLQRIADLQWVENVAPIQLAIRLLVPADSALFQIAGFDKRVEPFSNELLGYPWHHDDPAIDALQIAVQQAVEKGEQSGRSRLDIFTTLWQLAHKACNQKSPALNATIAGRPSPRLSEPWYCCAEPTTAQYAQAALGG